MALGDLAVVRDNRIVFGIGWIDSIEVVPGRKIRYRCPNCTSTHFKTRSTKQPTHRCAACTVEFDDPAQEEFTVQVFTANYSRTWRLADRPVTGAGARLGKRPLVVACNRLMSRIGKPLMNSKIDARELLERQKSHLQTHYLGLHVTVVSVALAIAGLTAGSLLGRHSQSSIEIVQLWLLWGASLLATAAAYAGPMVGVFAGRPSVPVIADLLLPLALGVVEFLLFGVLARQVIGTTSLNSIIIIWFILMAMFAAAAAGSVQQATHYYNKEAYTDDLIVIQCYVWRLRAEEVGTAFIFVEASTAVGLRLAGFNSTWLEIFFSGLIIMTLILGLVGHQRTAILWRSHYPFRSSYYPSESKSKICGRPCIPTEMRFWVRSGRLLQRLGFLFRRGMARDLQS